MTIEELKKYKDGLYSSLSRDLDAFEKNFILISSGILAFSVTFINEIVKIENAVFLPMLFIGWAFILASIGLMMFAFLSSVNGHNELWKIVDDFIIQNKFFDATQVLVETEALKIKESTNEAFYKIKDRLKCLRSCAIWTFLIGVLLFSTFVGINLLNENNKDKTTKIVNSKKGTITITTGVIETTTNDSIIIITKK